MTNEDQTFAQYLLTEIRGDLVRTEDKVDGVVRALTTVTNQMTALSIEGQAHQREDARRFDSLDRRLEKTEGNLDESGQHNLASARAQLVEVKMELKERDSTAAKEKRAFWGKIVVGVVLVLASAATSHLVTRLASTPAGASSK